MLHKIESKRNIYSYARSFCFRYDYYYYYYFVAYSFHSPRCAAAAAAIYADGMTVAVCALYVHVQ